MKPSAKLLLCTVIIAGAGICAAAQNPGWMDDLRDNPGYLAGTDYLCTAENTPLTRAPRGYKPFYLSHMGRHGARFVDGSKFYPKMYELWKSADEKGLLTPEGKKFYEAYAEVYPRMLYHEGILTGKGDRKSVV